MKKLIFLTSLLMVFTLSGCQEKPFDSDVEGFVYTISDELVFNFDSGVDSTELFRFTFNEELMMFINDDKTIYNFKNINDYQVASDQIEQLLTAYEGTVKYRTYEVENVDAVIELSAGATEDDYNLVDVTHDGDVLSEDAFITTENGVSMIISYTKFIVDGEDIYVPAYIQLFVDIIHKENSWDFLGSNNEYSEEPMKIINYLPFIVPLPAKTGTLSSFEEIQSNGIIVDDFSIAVNTSEDINDRWTSCSLTEIENCITSPTSTILEIQVYDDTINGVKVFYEENFGAKMIEGSFVFFNGTIIFELYDMEEVQVQGDNDDVVDVVNAKIRLY